MNYEFKSNFGEALNGLVAEKHALGIKYESYQAKLIQFDSFCSNEYPEETVLNQELVLNWVTLWPNETFANLKKRATVVRQLAKYLWRHGIPSFVLPEGFVGKSPRYNPHIFTKAELSSLFHVMDHCKPCKQYPFYHYVVPVIFRMIYTCGLRPGEALSLKTTDVNLRTGEILIREAKGHKDRIVVLSLDMLGLCRKYFDRRQLYYPQSDVFFPNYLGKAYSAPWIEKTFEKMWRKTGIKTCGSMPRIYDLRHTFATECLCRFSRQGKDLNAWLPYLSAYMGHLSYDSTAYYLHLVPAYYLDTSKGSSVFNNIVPEV